MEQIQADGIERLVAMCLAPQYSKMSVGFYFRRTQEAKQQLGAQVEIVWTKSFHSHPLLVEAFAERRCHAPTASPYSRRVVTTGRACVCVSGSSRTGAR